MERFFMAIGCVALFWATGQTFSADPNPSEPEPACTVEVQGKLIIDNYGKVQGCVSGSPYVCTYTISIPCP
jgi:hypothetical protein